MKEYRDILINKYNNDFFQNLMDMLARKNSIPFDDLDDYYQDIYFECLDSHAETEDDYKRCAYRVARRYGRYMASLKDENDDIITYSYDDERDRYFNDIDGEVDSPLWEDSHVIS